MTPEEIQAHNYFAGFFGFRPTPVWHWLMRSPSTITFLCCGNQYGKGETMVMDWMMRMLCKHPNKNKNIYPDSKFRTLRICTESLPVEKDGEDTKNTIYPVIKRRCPGVVDESGKYNGWIVKDITSRGNTLRLRPHFYPANRDINLEFVSYSQEVQRQAGVQRAAIMIDEEPSEEFYGEQAARMLMTGGDFTIGFTPVPGQIGWMFDNLFERARYIRRTPLVRERWKLRFGEDMPPVEKRPKLDDIMVIMAATDDNPMYAVLAQELSTKTGKIITAKEYLDDFFRDRYGDDDDIIDARRYGIFHQLSGKVYKQFTSRVHVIDGFHYFPMNVPHNWKHYRGIDYHQRNPWAVVWICKSPTNELFVYRDAAFAPGKYTTLNICQDISDISGDYTFRDNRIDPLANQIQLNTNFTTVEDMNRIFLALKSEGRGTGGFWQPWDTKGTIGREQLTLRLLNSLKVGRPFNNTAVEDGRTVNLPTIWFFDNCRHVIESMQNWRYPDYKTASSRQANDDNEKPQQKHSHFPITIECLLKLPDVSMESMHVNDMPVIRPKHYMTGG